MHIILENINNFQRISNY